ncbi:hypothetical protein VN24_18450 [Paenibacillus beijingensis]|uniref:Uncharacterized protein n=2 Tax=Paenibacillus beijingensis TaxID=1126833 RepID=A0A0D5NLI3_9BACL|nr:hypothetical protein VN24_18450 [Paenibacillus beijingensis]
MKLLFKKQIKPKFMSIYIKSNDHLYLVANSFNKDNWIVETDFYNEIPLEASDKEILTKFKECLDNCNKALPLDLNDKTHLKAICKITGYKSYTRATQGIKLISIEANDNCEYIITPTEKKKGQGYLHIGEKKIICNEVDLILSIRLVIKIVSISSE